jgi:hypothetical protein
LVKQSAGAAPPIQSVDERRQDPDNTHYCYQYEFNGVIGLLCRRHSDYGEREGLFRGIKEAGGQSGGEGEGWRMIWSTRLRLEQGERILKKVNGELGELLDK